MWGEIIFVSENELAPTTVEKNRYTRKRHTPLPHSRDRNKEWEYKCSPCGFDHDSTVHAS